MGSDRATRFIGVRVGYTENVALCAFVTFVYKH